MRRKARKKKHVSHRSHKLIPFAMPMMFEEFFDIYWGYSFDLQEPYRHSALFIQKRTKRPLVLQYQQTCSRNYRVMYFDTRNCESNQILCHSRKQLISCIYEIILSHEKSMNLDNIDKAVASRLEYTIDDLKYKMKDWEIHGRDDVLKNFEKFLDELKPK